MSDTDEWTTDELLRKHVRCTECDAESRPGFRTPSQACPALSSKLPTSVITRGHTWEEVDQ
jgi:hypothetical protein